MQIAAIRTRIVRWPIAGDGAARGRTERAAILVEVELASGHIGLGEAAPLPGMSADSFDDAAAAITAFAARAPFAIEQGDATMSASTQFEHAGATTSGSTRLAQLAAGARSPAARFAIETALLSALAASMDQTLADLLGSLAGAAPATELPCAVVVDDPDAAVRAVAAGARCLKIKVGPTGDLDRVIAIHHAAPEVTLRIDANRSWSRALTRPLLHALAELPIELVEEPCPDAHELLAEPLPCPIALDESLVGMSAAQLAAALDSPGLAAIVLKPTLLGGLSACLALAERARAAGKDVIVTHALEGPIGTAACAELALALAGQLAHHPPAGLAPHPALAGWNLEPLEIEPTRIHRGAPRPVTLRLADLDLVARTPLATPGPAPHLADLELVARPPLAGLARTVETPTRATVDAIGAMPSRAAADTRLVATPAPETIDATVAAASGTAAATRILVATPATATVDAIRAALDSRRPLALLHARLPAAELARQRALVEAARLPADTAFVLFTSGSTGPARGVVLSRAAIDSAVAASASHLGWRDGDRWLLALSTAHAGGLAVVARCHAAGVPLVLLDGDFDRDRCAALLAGCTLASLVPTQLAALLDDPAWRPARGLRAVLLGGAAAGPALLERAAARGVPFLATYGLTETFGQIATAPLARTGDPAAPLTLLPGVEVIAGSRDAPAPIELRAPMLATAYLDGAPIAPRFTTADLGFVEGGALHVIGRIDDVIITGGEKVHPGQVEAVLAATTGVRAACVFGVADPRWGQIVAAAITTDAGFDEAHATATWRAALPPHARPRELAILDALPLLPSGKIDRARAAQLPRQRRP